MLPRDFVVDCLHDKLHFLLVIGQLFGRFWEYFATIELTELVHAPLKLLDPAGGVLLLNLKLRHRLIQQFDLLLESQVFCITFFLLVFILDSLFSRCWDEPC